MAVSAIAAIAGIGLGVYKTVKANSAAKKAKEEQDKLKFPFYKIQDEYYQNRNLEASRAGQGLPTATMDYITNQNQRGLGSGISAIQQGGGDVNDIAKLSSVFANSVNQTGAEDAQQQVKNLAYFMNENATLAGQKNIRFGLNEKQPYDQKLKNLTEVIGAEKQNMNNGLYETASGIGALGTQFSNHDLLRSLLEKRDDPYASPQYVVPANVAPISSADLRQPSNNTIQPLTNQWSGQQNDIFDLLQQQTHGE